MPAAARALRAASNPESRGGWLRVPQARDSGSARRARPGM